MKTFENKEVDLNNLVQFYKFSPVWCDYVVEAACVCLENFGHEPGVQLDVVGSFQGKLTLIWKKLQPEIKFSWLRFDRTIQPAARALAILCIENLTSLQVVGKASKAEGFDFWLGEKNSMETAPPVSKLEISGILQGSKAQVNFRMKEKIQHVKNGIHPNLPAFVVVSEFSQPLVKIEQL